MFRMDAADDGGEQTFGIRRSFYDGAGEGSAEQGGDLIGHASRFPEDLPDGGKLGVGKPFADWFGKLPDGLEALMVVVELVQKIGDGGAMKEADGKATGIRLFQSQHVEWSLWIAKIAVFRAAPNCREKPVDLIDPRLILGAAGLLGVFTKHRTKYIFKVRLTFRPMDNC